MAYSATPPPTRSVIAYRGTDGLYPGMMGADGANNIGLTLGQATSQAVQAAKGEIGGEIGVRFQLRSFQQFVKFIAPGGH